MTLMEKLGSISKPAVKSLATGKSDSLEAFWIEVVEPNLPDETTVLAWHELLMNYVKMEHPVLAIRGYNSFPPEKYGDLRRGFLTKTDGFSFFYTDNYFAAYFQKMVMDGFVPEEDELAAAFAQRKFPSRFGQITSQEKALLAIPQGKDPRINAAGFKLAHIIPVGKEYCAFGKVIGGQEMLATYFPKGERLDWTRRTDGFGAFYARDYESDVRAKQYAVAEFLRFVHPFNYFLSPKKTCESNKKCKEIAEYQPLLDYAHDFMLRTYKDAYREYLELVMADERYANPCFDIAESALEISYGLKVNPAKGEALKKCSCMEKEIEEIQKKIDALKSSSDNPEKLAAVVKLQEKLDSLKAGVLEERGIAETKTARSLTRTAVSSVCMRDLEIQMAVEYLSNSKTSFRKIEAKYMGIESAARGGGFKAKESINRLGITADQKGILEKVTIDVLIARSTGAFLVTLQAVKEYLEKA